MLASNAGLTYAKVSCEENELLSVITLGERSLSCDMALSANSCENEKQDDDSCCDSSYANVNMDDNYNKSSFNLYLSVPFLSGFSPVFQHTKITPQLLYSRVEYSPPLLNYCIPVLYQVFTI